MCARGKREKRNPPTQAVSVWPLLQNVGGLLYFRLGGKETKKGLYWESREGCPSREPQMLRKPRRWCGLCIGNSALPASPLAPTRGPRPPGPPAPAAYLRYGRLPRSLPGVWQPAARPLHNEAIAQEDLKKGSNN